MCVCVRERPLATGPLTWVFDVDGAAALYASYKRDDGALATALSPPLGRWGHEQGNGKLGTGTWTPWTFCSHSPALTRFLFFVFFVSFIPQLVLVIKTHFLLDACSAKACIQAIKHMNRQTALGGREVHVVRAERSKRWPDDLVGRFRQN